MGATGCATLSGGGSTETAPLEPPSDEPAALPIAIPAPAATAEDSLADQDALEALHELEFKSLAKGADHVQGVLSAPRLPRGGTDAGPRGGPSSVEGPVSDIDVASFADRDRVRYYLDFFQGPARNRFAIWLGRLPRYEGMIRARFRKLSIPEDLVYLTLIESGLSNTAVSRANAVGMWQFIASTAKGYGLAVNTWLDERRDPFKATEAAGRHLADLYAQFGSWYLAAAAYNGGAGRVSRGLRRLTSTPDSLTDETFFDLSAGRYLRRETRDYVPKLIAAVLIAKNPAGFGFDSIPTVPPLAFDEITVDDATGLDVLAELADTSSRALLELNPQFVRGVTSPDLTSVVRVPRGTGSVVVQRLATLPASERVNWVEHVVRAGETLSEIGERYGVSVKVLRAANGNVHPRRVRIGRRLVVPVSAAARSRAATGRAPRPRPVVSGVRYHTVRRGESLWTIARRYGVGVGDVARWNGIDPEGVLRVGKRLALTPPSRRDD